MILRLFRKTSWLQRIRVLFIAAFAYPIGLWALAEFAHAMQASSLPVKSGIIVQREAIRRFGGIPASRYVIQLEDTGPTVHAILAGSQLHEFPLHVKVHFSGDATQEVRLVGEESPWIVLLVTVLMWGLPIVLLWLYAKGGPFVGEGTIQSFDV